MSAKRRPESIAEMLDALGGLVSRKGAERGLAFAPRPDDLIIAPFSKCGTTWLQQIVHTLRTRGDMDFDDISRVIPWIEVSHDLGLDLDAAQRGQPRAFKSHLDWDRVPKGGRYLVSFRDPRDALVSAFRFLEGWFFATGSIDLETWARSRFAADRKTGYWNHLRSWWTQRDNPAVCLLCFEDLVADLPAAVDAIATFAGIELDDELRAVTLEHASFAFMKAHADRFDDRMMRERSEAVCGLPEGSDSNKVRAGKVGGGASDLSPGVLELLDEIWAEEIATSTGLESYDALRRALAQ